MRPGYWFKPKRFGVGAVPATWQGWALTFGLAVAAFAIGSLAEHRGAALAVLLVPLLVGFLWPSWQKTDGDWHWGWGRDGD
jgi:hypothetical protein